MHCVEPLNIKRQAVKDVQIRSVGYDRRQGRLEIEFTWTDDVRQFYPVSPAVYRQLLAAKPMYLFLNRLLALKSIREQRVRTEAGRVLMMARGEIAGSLNSLEPSLLAAHVPQCAALIGPSRLRIYTAPVRLLRVICCNRLFGQPDFLYKLRVRFRCLLIGQ